MINFDDLFQIYTCSMQIKHAQSSSMVDRHNHNLWPVAIRSKLFHNIQVGHHWYIGEWPLILATNNPTIHGQSLHSGSILHLVTDKTPHISHPLRKGLHVQVSIKYFPPAYIHVHVPEIGWLKFFVKYYTSFQAIPTFESKDSMICFRYLSCYFWTIIKLIYFLFVIPQVVWIHNATGTTLVIRNKRHKLRRNLCQLPRYYS